MVKQRLEPLPHRKTLSVQNSDNFPLWSLQFLFPRAAWVSLGTLVSSHSHRPTACMFNWKL